MSNNTAWFNETVVRSTLVVPTYGPGMGDARLQAAGCTTGFSGGFAAVTPMVKRHLDAIQATPASVPPPWSPPVT